MGPGYILNNHVVGLNLYSNNLTGHIPSSINKLNHLQVLDMAFNELEGKLPQEIGMLKDLKPDYEESSSSF